ncbi:NAD(P)-dependent oxidoreductase [Pontiellaceae bacterium B12227]|nr:NAD(P)-dependent oxidoreductase [Pontiellaceae bacterium B12227]
MAEKIKAAFFVNGNAEGSAQQAVNAVYTADQRNQLAERTDFYPEIITSDNLDEHLGKLQDLQVIFSTWGMLPLTGEQVRQFPQLSVLFYAAGATRPFRAPFEENGVIVCSASSANAVPVAEFALAQILLAGAGYFQNVPTGAEVWNEQRTRCFEKFGNYRQRVSILGNGRISALLQKWLKQHCLEVVVIPSRAERRAVSLAEGFSSSAVVVNLFPDRDDNVGVLNAPLFEQMPPNAVFMNVGRGRQVDEAGLIRVMKNRPDLTALLDVQIEEPPPDGSELYSLPNIRLSAHIAGSKGRELARMADYMIEEFSRFEKGEPLRYQVEADQL